MNVQYFLRRIFVIRNSNCLLNKFAGNNTSNKLAQETYKKVKAFAKKIVLYLFHHMMQMRRKIKETCK